MTFNQKDRFSQSPLLSINRDRDSEIWNLIGEIENNFIEFNRYYNDLKEFHRKLPTFTRKEYEKLKDDVHYKIQLIPNILKAINLNTDKISHCKSGLTEELNEKIEVIKQKINPKVSELPLLMNEISEREKSASLRLRNIKATEQELDQSISRVNKSDHISDSKFMIREVIENQVYLEKRKEELETIKRVTNQLKEITVMMGQEVKIQGENLNKILEDVDVVKQNVTDADSEISRANRESQNSFKKIILICLAILLVVCLIITVIICSFK